MKGRVVLGIVVGVVLGVVGRGMFLVRTGWERVAWTWSEFQRSHLSEEPQLVDGGLCEAYALTGPFRYYSFMDD